MLGTASVLTPPVAAAPAEQSIAFDVPSQNLAQALTLFARQSGIQLLYPYDVAVARRSRGVRGRMTARKALERLLRQSGLEIATDTGGVVTLRAARPQAPMPPVAKVGPPKAVPLPPPSTPPVRDIVVTGRALETPMSAPQLSYALTRIDGEMLAQQGPLSTADIFKQIPGFWVEATGGEASNNVRSRGIPTDGYSSVALLEDGLPVQYDGGLGYLNTDQIYRVDATIKRVEAVRGGPSAIFAPNAPGGSIEFLTRNGLRDPGYSVSATLGDFGYQRIEGYAGVRIAPHLGLSVGGFYRTGDGLRDPGYPADRGGQIRAGITYDDGPLRLSFNVKHLDDRVILYLPVPLQLDGHGQVQAIPGFDPLFDTLAGPDNVHVPFKTADGPQDFDLSQGTHSRITFYTLTGRMALGDRSALELRARLRTGVTIRNGLFPVGRPMTAADYLAGISSQLGMAYPGTAAARIAYADTGEAFLSGANGNGLVVGANLLSVRLPMDEFIGDARFTSSIEQWGHHDVALGVTHAESYLAFDRIMGTVLLDVRGQARRLNVIAVNASGQQVGALTDQGFTRYGSLFENIALQTSNIALYFADEWAIAPRWRVDLGGRWERTRIGGTVEGTTSLDLGDPSTLADNAVLTGNGINTPIDRHFSGLSWTAGVNFHPAESSGLFLRYTRIARLPGATEFNAAPDRTDEAIVPITMWEAGLTVQHSHWTLSAVAFKTHFTRLPFTDHRFDPDQNAYVDRTLIADTSAIGLELSGHADLPGPFQLDAQATLQDAQYRNFRYTELVYGLPVAQDATGNQLIRVPKLSIQATPSIVLLKGALRVGVDYVHHSSRFADVANTQRLPAFSLINAHVNARLTRHVSLALHATNLTNALGLTEGNPRTGSFDSGGMSAKYFMARPEFGRTVRATLSLTY